MNRQTNRMPYIPPSLELFHLRTPMSLLIEFSLESGYEDWEDGAPLDASSSYGDWGSGPEL